VLQDRGTVKGAGAALVLTLGLALLDYWFE
jgi:hypothetical protein